MRLLPHVFNGIPLFSECEGSTVVVPHPFQYQSQIFGVLLTMVTSEVKYISCITFQSSNDLSHEVLILIIIPIIGDASRPLTEGLARTLGVAGFTIKLWDVDFVINSPFFLLHLCPVEESETLVELLKPAVSEPLSQVSVLDPHLLCFPLLPLLRFFFLGVTVSVVAPSSSKV